MPRITTEQAPSAKPLRVSKELTTSWQTFIDVPDYDVPVVGFGISRRIAPGIAEVSSPILISNFSATSANCDIRVVDAARPLVAGQTELDFAVWESGSGYSTGEVITMTNGANVTVTGDVGGQISSFEITTVGDSVVALPEPLEQATSSAGGVGFNLVVTDSNLSTTEGFYYLGKGIPVRPNDTLIFPTNGQFLNTRDQLQIKAGADSQLQATLSFTEGQAEEDDIFF